jgi:anthranilate phosphoribosyltransferase
MIKEYLEKISLGESLSRAEAATALRAIIAGDLTATEIGALLIGLRMKGESVEEIQGCIDTMRANMVTVDLDDPDTLDVCGTGGDQKHTFNVSTITAIVAAAGGATVAKHGNRAVSSKSGSADVLEELGARIDLTPDRTRQCLAETGLGFFFAPLYHPVMKIMGPHRRNLGIRTIFNMLGPLLNPAGVKRQLIGTYDKVTAHKTAAVLKQRDYRKACVVHSAEGFDEVSPYASNYIFEVQEGEKEVLTYTYKFENSTQTEAVQGGNCSENAALILAVLKGEKGFAREMTLANVAFAFYVADKVNSVLDGLEMAAEIIDSGKALRKLNQFIEYSRILANRAQ